LIVLSKCLKRSMSSVDKYWGLQTQRQMEHLCITLGVNFTNILRPAFTGADPKSVKKRVKLSIFFYAFGIFKRKSCTKNVDEIDTRSPQQTTVSRGTTMHSPKTASLKEILSIQHTVQWNKKQRFCLSSRPCVLTEFRGQL